MATLTAKLSKLFARNRTRPRRPVAIDVFSARRRSPDQAAESMREMIDPPKPQPEPVVDADASEVKPVRSGLLSRFKKEMPGAKRDAAIAHLKEGYDEVVDLMRTVRGHLTNQSERSQKLLEMMRHMPEALQSLPETNRNQSRMLEVIQTHLEQQRRHGEQFAESMRALTRVTEQQNQIMGVIQQHMDASAATDNKLLGSFNAMNQTLENLNESTRSTSTNLRELNERAESSERRTQEMIDRTSKQMTILSITSWAMAAIALGVAVYAVTMLG